MIGTAVDELQMQAVLHAAELYVSAGILMRKLAAEHMEYKEDKPFFMS